MNQQTIDGIYLHEMFSTGYRNLKKNMDAINDLNVFPVPDGDTGTNMVQTLRGGISSSSICSENVGTYMQNLSKAILLSARGNSGVILSQFIYGLGRSFADKTTLRFVDFVDGFKCAKEDAYKSIVTPTEGTILTLIREAYEFLSESATYETTFEDGFDSLVLQLKDTLRRTPEMLPVLKKAGVVDSGGAGLVAFFEGISTYLHGGNIEDTGDLFDNCTSSVMDTNFGPDSELEYGYCTEFILQLMNRKTNIQKFDLSSFVQKLETLGDSIVAVHNDSIVKIHIHTFMPDEALKLARMYGEFVTVKIENMSIQHNELDSSKPKEKVKYALISVASGVGIIDTLYEIGSNFVIEGGQTSNPSVDDFLKAFAMYDAEHIVVMPNNPNIIFTANQAAELYTSTPVHVLPTRSVVEGYAALSMADPDSNSVEELLNDMNDGFRDVITGYVTTAIRDTCLNDLNVQAGQYIGLSGKNILSVGIDKLETTKELICKIADPTTQEIILVFYGANASSGDVTLLQNFLQENYPNSDIGFIDGQQDIYDFIISL